MSDFSSTKGRVLAAIGELMAAADVPEDLVEKFRAALQPEKTDAALTEPEKQTLELVMRMYMDELLVASKKPGASIEAAGVPKLLDIAIALAAGEGCDYNTPFALLEDLFDAHVISVAESAFALVEARAAALAPFLGAEPKFQRCKLTLIRSCNELLRRLSKSKNTNFRGRVLMFMAYTFPLAERSGVNLKGVAAPSTVAIEEEEGDDPMTVEAPAGGEASAGAGGGGGEGGSGVVDFGFYATFWGLQQAFASPAASVAKERWASLVENLQTVLQVFGSFSGDADEAGDAPAGGATAAAAAAEGGDGGAAAEAEGEALEEVYFAKFLTSSKLITLQLRDGYFRRHVLVQILIFLQAVTTERKGQPVLGASQRQQVEALHARCIELLRAIPPAGQKFADSVLGMLEREEHWIKWKANGCQAFDKAEALSAVGEGKKRKAPAGLGAVKRMQLGNAALTKLWNSGSNDLEDIAQRQQDMMPALVDYLRPVFEQANPDEGIEEEYKVKNDKSFCWKAFRLISKHNVGLLGKVSQQNGSLEVAVKHFFEVELKEGESKEGEAAKEGEAKEGESKEGEAEAGGDEPAAKKLKTEEPAVEAAK